jgi:hypothetical protein
MIEFNDKLNYICGRIAQEVVICGTIFSKK